MPLLLEELTQKLPQWAEYTADWNNMFSKENNIYLLWRRWKQSWVVILGTTEPVTPEKKSVLLKTQASVLKIIKGSGILYLGKKNGDVLDTTETTELAENETYYIENIEENDYFHIESHGPIMVFLILSKLSRKDRMVWVRELPQRVESKDEERILALVRDTLSVT